MHPNTTAHRRMIRRLALVGIAVLALAAGLMGPARAEPSGFTITPPTLHFGQVPAGSTSPEQKVSLINDTGLDYRIFMTQTGSVSSFSLDDASCQRDAAGAFVVPAQLACLVYFRFQPHTAGDASMRILWTSETTGEQWETNLTGTGTHAAPGLVAHPAVVQLKPMFTVTLTVAATLTLGNGAGPAAGETIVFEASGTTICQATTNSAGNASCGGPAGSLQAVLGLGYTARFPGSATLSPASAQGALIG